MTNSIAGFENSGCIFIIGTNTTACHPLIASRIFRAKEKGAKLIVADPRQIQLSRFADVSVHHRLGTDVALLNGMMHVIIKNGWHDKKYIEERDSVKHIERMLNIDYKDSLLCFYGIYENNKDDSTKIVSLKYNELNLHHLSKQHQ